MAGFQTNTFSKHDDWMTPKNAWENIKAFIPQKQIWEPFYGNGQSGQYLTELGFDVIHQDIDFFNHNLGEIIVSNPPFTLVPRVLERLVELDKPFIMILPSSKINTQYFRKLFKGGIQLIIPRKRIQFEKYENGEPIKHKAMCNFDCFYYCYKIGLERDLIWLE
jgi:hypothetical protein